MPIVESPGQTAALAAQLAPHLAAPLRLYLSGELGAGKTFFARALLSALGEGGRVPSPSYALVHSYTPQGSGGIKVHHLDCYRLQGAPAGDDLLELLQEDALCLLEWHEHAANLPPPDLHLHLAFCPPRGETARELRFTASSAKAQPLLAVL